MLSAENEIAVVTTTTNLKDDQPKSSIEPTHRRIFLWDEILGETAVEIVSNLILMADDDSEAPIELWINSAGGDAAEAFAIYDVMNSIACPVYTIGVGNVSSMAIVLLASGEPGHRYIMPSTLLMIHNISSQFSGTYEDLHSRLREVYNVNDIYKSTLLQHTNITDKQLEEILQSNLDHCITAKEALSLGIADHIGYLPE